MEFLFALLIAVVCFAGGYYYGKDTNKGKTLSESETEAIRQVLNVLSWTGGADEDKDKA